MKNEKEQQDNEQEKEEIQNIFEPKNIFDKISFICITVSSVCLCIVVLIGVYKQNFSLINFICAIGFSCALLGTIITWLKGVNQNLFYFNFLCGIINFCLFLRTLTFS